VAAKGGERREVSDPRKKLGRRGEWLATLLLLLKGYRIRHRNWTCALGEIDLVMQRRDTIVFTEIKTRSSEDFGGAAAAVDARKQQRLARLASVYLSQHRLWETPCRFDVVAVQREQAFPWWRLSHIVDAFRPDLGRQM
jgi:putative endonuclease